MPDTPFRSLLERIHMTQTEVSRRWGIPLRTVQHWAAGDRPCPTWVQKLIADASRRKDDHDDIPRG